MADVNVRKVLIEATKCSPKEGEAEVDFQRRLVKAVDKLPDAGWETLPPLAQKWANAAGEAFAADKPEDVPPLVGDNDSAQEGDDVKKPKTSKKATAATKAPAKKAAATKPAKAAKPTTKPGRRADRMPDEARIRVLAETNPHRKDTHLYRVFAKYKDGMTVAEALKAIAPVSGNTAPRANLAWQVNQGHLRIELPA